MIDNSNNRNEGMLSQPIKPLLTNKNELKISINYYKHIIMVIILFILALNNFILSMYIFKKFLIFTN